LQPLGSARASGAIRRAKRTRRRLVCGARSVKWKGRTPAWNVLQGKGMEDVLGADAAAIERAARGGLVDPTMAAQQIILSNRRRGEALRRAREARQTMPRFASEAEGERPSRAERPRSMPSRSPFPQHAQRRRTEQKGRPCPARTDTRRNRPRRSRVPPHAGTVRRPYGRRGNRCPRTGIRGRRVRLGSGLLVRLRGDDEGDQASRPSPVRWFPGVLLRPCYATQARCWLRCG
jgi:hypothetical protein